MILGRSVWTAATTALLTINDEPQTSLSARSAVSLRAKSLLKNAFQNGRPAPADWDAVFQSGEFSSEVLAEVAQQLHQKRQFDDAVECLLASLRNDHAQPWTYDVLAIEMKLAKRPDTEINRVLQSRSDFTSGNVTQQMLIAAMLVRFDAYELAMDVCRRNAAASPDSAEVWLQAKGIADRIQSPLDQVWARCGVLRHVWVGDYEKQHTEAVATIQAIADSMDRVGKRQEAQQARQDLLTARQIDLRIIVEWIGEADLDLIVDEPNGAQTSFSSPVSTNGGRLIRSDSGAARGTSSKNREEYVCVQAVPGKYSARIRFVFGKVVNGTAVVQVIQDQNSSSQKVIRKAVALSKQDAVLDVLIE